MSHLAEARASRSVSLAVLATCAAAALFLYRESFLQVVGKWQDSTYAYGAAVPLICAYLVWLRRSALGSASLQPSWPGVLLVAVLGAGWLAARAAGVSAAEQLAAVATLPALLMALLGWPAFRVVAFPSVYLLMCVPIGEILVPGLMDLTANAAVFGVRAVGIPVFRDEYVISVPAGTFEVIKACSGIRFLLVTLTLMIPFAYLQFRKTWIRIAFVVDCAVVAVLANGVRAFLLIVAGQVSDMRWVAGEGHVLIGQVWFGLVLLLMIYAGVRLGDAGRTGQSEAPVDATARSRVDALPFAGIACLVLLLLAARASEAVARASLQAAESIAPLTPNAVPPWREAPSDSVGWQPSFHGYSNLATASYVSEAGHAVGVYMAHYPGSAASGRELINSENRLYNPDTEKSSRPLGRLVDVGGGAGISIIETTISGKTTGNNARLTWTWYEVEGVMTASATKLKMLALVALGRSEPAVQRVVVLHTSIADGNLETGRRRLADFLEHQLPGLRMVESTVLIRQASRDADPGP